MCILRTVYHPNVHHMNGSNLTGFAYLSGLEAKGYHSCPTCGTEHFEGEMCPYLKKMIFMGHTKYLPMNH